MENCPNNGKGATFMVKKTYGGFGVGQKTQKVNYLLNPGKPSFFFRNSVHSSPRNDDSTFEQLIERLKDSSSIFLLSWNEESPDDT